MRGARIIDTSRRGRPGLVFDNNTFDGAWFDIGTPESYLDALTWHLDGNSRVHPDAIIQDASIGENVHVMAGAEIHDATLERTVVFPGASIRDSSLHNSIVDEQAHIEGLDLADTLVGE